MSRLEQEFAQPVRSRKASGIDESLCVLPWDFEPTPENIAERRRYVSIALPVLGFSPGGNADRGCSPHASFACSRPSNYYLPLNFLSFPPGSEKTGGSAGARPCFCISPPTCTAKTTRTTMT